MKEKNNDYSIISPTDGTVVSSIAGNVPVAFGSVWKILIDLPPSGRHSQKSPMSGMVKRIENKDDRTMIVIESTTQSNVSVVLTIVSGKNAPLRSISVREGQKVRAGDEIGVIETSGISNVVPPFALDDSESGRQDCLSSQVEVGLAVSARVLIKAGDNTKAGHTVLAQIY